MQAENLEDILSKRTGLHKGFSSKSENEYIRLDRCSIRVAERMADLNSSGFEDTGEIRSLARSLVVLEWRACSGWNQCRLLLLLLLRQRSALALRDGNGLRSAPSDIATRGRGRVAKPDKVMQQRSSWRRCGARRNVK
mgnify:FL=1